MFENIILFLLLLLLLLLCHAPTPCTNHARPRLPVNQSPILTPPNTGPVALHDTAAELW